MCQGPNPDCIRVIAATYKKGFFLSIFSLSPMEQASCLICFDTVNDYPMEYSIQPALHSSTVSKEWLMTGGIFPAARLSLRVQCSSSEGFTVVAAPFILCEDTAFNFIFGVDFVGIFHEVYPLRVQNWSFSLCCSE